MGKTLRWDDDYEKYDGRDRQEKRDQKYQIESEKQKPENKKGQRK